MTLLMYTREYLIALFFPAQHPYWFVSVVPRNPIPFPPKNIETEVEMRFFRPFPSVFIAIRLSLPLSAPAWEPRSQVEWGPLIGNLLYFPTSRGCWMIGELLEDTAAGRFFSYGRPLGPFKDPVRTA